MRTTCFTSYISFFYLLRSMGWSRYFVSCWNAKLNDFSVLRGSKVIPLLLSSADLFLYLSLFLSISLPLSLFLALSFSSALFLLNSHSTACGPPTIQNTEENIFFWSSPLKRLSTSAKLAKAEKIYYYWVGNSFEIIVSTWPHTHTNITRRKCDNRKPNEKNYQLIDEEKVIQKIDCNWAPV